MVADLEELKNFAENSTVLFVENDKETRRMLEELLFPMFSAFFVAETATEAYELYSLLVKQTRIDLVVIDLSLGDLDSLNLIHKIKELHQEQAVILLAADEVAKIFVDTLDAGVQNYILKPIDQNRLYAALQKALISSNKSNSVLEYKHELEEQVARQTTFISNILSIDSLTGIENENGLSAYLESYDGAQTILLIKITNLQNIKNYAGKIFADSFVKEIVTLFCNFFENSGKVSRIYRVDFDEIATLIESDSTYVKKIAHELSMLAKYFYTMVDGVTLNSSIKIGIYSGDKNLLYNAKSALIKAMMDGTEMEYLQDVDLTFDNKCSQNIYWLYKFSQSIENDSLVPYYQPIIDNSTGKSEIYECLARITDRGSLIYPEKFLQLVSKVRQIPFLTRIIIKKTFEYFSDKPECMFSINLSSQDILDETLPMYIDYWRNKLNIDLTRVIFEIVETEDFYTKISFKHTLIRLREMGCKVALDNFGVADSNIISLYKCRFDYIKIDGAIIEQLETDPMIFEAIECIHKLIKLTGAKSVAEKVSSVKILNLVKSIGIDYSQGFAISEAKDTI